MGVFDYVTCHYDVPGVENISKIEFQSKDTDAQYLNQYEIRADGTLWHHAHDIRVEVTDKAPLGAWFHRINERWEQVMFTGEIEIYSGDYDIQFWFRDGVVKDYVLTKDDGTE